MRSAGTTALALEDVRKSFGKVHIRKPDASRSESREVYFVAKEFKPG